MLAFLNFCICREKRKKKKHLVLGKNKMWFHWGSYSWRIFCQSSEWFSDDQLEEKFLQKKKNTYMIKLYILLILFYYF